jgi:hypothetical protein
MAIYTFGAGELWGVRTDITNPTPRQFGVMQSCSVEFSATSKELYGQKQFPVAIARGTAKIQCKAKFGQIQGSVFSDLFFNSTLNTGRVTTVQNEVGTIPSATPYTYTAVNAGSSGVNFVEDLGVLYAATGLPMQLVASGPTVGQYSVSSAGVYTFAAADEGLGIWVSYVYSITASGQSMTLANPDLGIQPVFQAVFTEKYNAPGGLKTATLRLHACISDKLSVGSKQEDFDIPELDFSAFADQSGNVFDWNFSEVS